MTSTRSDERCACSSSTITAEARRPSSRSVSTPSGWILRRGGKVHDAAGVHLEPTLERAAAEHHPARGIPSQPGLITLRGDRVALGARLAVEEREPESE